MGIGPIVHSWDEWASVYNDLEVWRDAVHEILSREGITYNTIEKGYPGTSAVFIIDRKYVLKIYPGQFINDHNREWPVLSHLENLYNQPLLLATGEFLDREMIWPYGIMRYIHGTAYRELLGQLSGQEMGEFIFELSKTLRKIHSLPFDSLMEHSVYHLSFSEDEIRKQIEKLCQLPFFSDDQFKIDLNRFVERQKPLLEKQARVFVHGDLTRDHLFFNKENGKWHLADVIDWGDARIAPVLYDFVVLWADVFTNQRKEWESLLQLYDGDYDTKDLHFRRLFTVMLFLHPFARDLILNAYEGRAVAEQPKLFRSVNAFIQWVFIS